MKQGIDISIPDITEGSAASDCILEEVEGRHSKSPTSPESKKVSTLNNNGGSEEGIDVYQKKSILSSAKSYAWPESRRLEVLQVEVARQLLESELLVQEDEDFVNNFLLTDEALEHYRQYTSEGGASSILGDVLLFSGR